jgi:hypothetical protein
MSDEPKKSRQIIFATEVLPDLFHHTPVEMINLLASRGNDFLKFYWDIAGKQALPDSNSSIFGLNYDIRTFLKETTICLVTLPKPVREREAYFVSLIYRPYRRTPFLGITDATRVITLELDSTQASGTFLRDWDKRLLPERLGAGPEPRLEVFYKTVCDLIKDESR